MAFLCGMSEHASFSLYIWKIMRNFAGYSQIDSNEFQCMASVINRSYDINAILSALIRGNKCEFREFMNIKLSSFGKIKQRFAFKFLSAQGLFIFVLFYCLHNSQNQNTYERCVIW